MVKVLPIAGLLMMLCLPSCGHSALPSSKPPTRRTLPPAVAKFRDTVTKMEAKEALAEGVREFGEPSRDVGSGLSIPEWNLDGGVLEVHPLVGPTFRFDDGTIVWLIPTRNPAEENVLQDFEMTTPANPANHGTRFWIGDVRITKNRLYHYTDSGMNRHDRGDQSGNSFLNHPDGRIEVIWTKGIDANSCLESLGERQIANLRFVANDGKTAFEAGVVSSDQIRRLSILGPTFEMDRGWVHYWLKEE